MIANFKTFENVNKYSYEINNHMGLFDICDDYNCVELVQEDLTAIKEILHKEKKYNTYISDEIEIYLYDNILTIISSDIKIDINSYEFLNLLQNIHIEYDKVAKYEEISNEEYKATKKNIEDYVRSAKKYNL